MVSWYLTITIRAPFWNSAVHSLRKMPPCNNLNANNPSSTLNPVQDPMSLFYVNPNENPAASIVSSPLTGTNHHKWARVMQ